MTKVFDPIMVGQMEVKNRLWTAPLVCNHATEEGHVTPKLIENYHERAKGGWGLVQVEATYVRKDGNMFARMLGFYTTHQITGMNELACAIKEGGARATIQLVHGGRQANPRFNGVGYTVAPSPVALGDITARELTTKEIEEIIELYALRCSWAKEAGFDAVVLHGAHGFLIGEFASPYTNQRSDKYGKDRYLFARELVAAVKEACGSEYPIMIRISAEEFLGDKGLTIEEVCQNYVPILEEAGIVHIDVSAGVFETGDMIIQPLYSKRAIILHLAEAVKKIANSATVSGVGRINDPLLVQSAIEKERADAICLGRQALADPDFPRKMLEGRPEDIRKCIYCDLGCTYRHVSQYSVDCSINPRLYHETEFMWALPDDSLPSASTSKRVIVIGGGISGMEAARVAKLRGHEVTIYEKASKLGGTVAAAASIPNLFTRELNNINQWEQTQIKKLGVEVKLNSEVNIQIIEEFQPDAVIFAAGSLEFKPDIPGINGSNVLTLLEYLEDPKQAGDNVVILGGQEGAEIAVGLARQKKNVVLLEESELIADTPYFIHSGRRSELHRFMFEEGFAVYTSSKLKEITKTSVVFEAIEPRFVDGQPDWMTAGSYVVKKVETKDDKEKSVERNAPADTVILALGRHSNRSLMEDLKNVTKEIYEVGDATDVKDIRHSIHSAAKVGRII